MYRCGTNCFAALLIFVLAGCRPSDRPAAQSAQTTLTIGYGLTAGARTNEAVNLMTKEGLINVGADGRPAPWLAESWSASTDGLSVRLQLRPNVSFHDGTHVTAAVIREILVKQLPANMGPFFADIQSIEAPSETEIIFKLNRRSSFLLEALSLLLQSPTSRAGTGPFAVASEDGTELRASEKYRSGKPAIDRIVIRPYASVRGAWADLLRNQVDMVYEIGSEALDLLQPASSIRIFSFHRPYAFVLVFNLRNPSLKDPQFRRLLNNSIDRSGLVTRVLDTHARPALSPIWPDHWAAGETVEKFTYSPQPIESRNRPAITLLFSDPSHERMAIFVQQQLQAIGIDLRLELSTIEQGMARATSGNFDLWLADMGLGPGLLRPSLFWRSGSPYNWGAYSSQKIDTALDAIDQADGDSAYRKAVQDFERALVDDPPAVFLAWSERARAISNRFDVHAEPERDVLSTLRLWRPVAAATAAHN